MTNQLLQSFVRAIVESAIVSAEDDDQAVWETEEVEESSGSGAIVGSLVPAAFSSPPARNKKIRKS